MIKKKLIKIYLLLANINYFLFFKKPKILSYNDTIQDIITNKKSLSRFGDGELRLILDEGEIGFQSRSQLLTKRLNEVLDSQLDSLLIALPNTFGLSRKQTLDSQIFWYGYLHLYGKAILKRLDLSKLYGDATITRFYIAYKDKSEITISNKIKLLKNIWDNKDILIVEGLQTKLGVENDLFDNSKSIKRILCPAKDAFNKYEEILNSTKEYGRNKLVLIALGPTASVLAYDLAKEGFWALDIGHIDIEYSWFMKKVNEKIPIEGKYVNEATITIDSRQQYDKSYTNSIILNIND